MKVGTCYSLVGSIDIFGMFQVVDLQVFAFPRITLKPLVPSFPCFAKILVSLMEKVSDNYFLPMISNATLLLQIKGWLSFFRSRLLRVVLKSIWMYQTAK